MKQDEYRRMHDFELFYWWHVGRRHIVETLLRRFVGKKQNQILEIGCGTGGNMGMLVQFGDVIGLDPSKEALDFCKDRGYTNVVQAMAEKTTFDQASFDLIVALDVFEHIEDDKKAFQETFRVMKSDGYLLTTVPAYQFLWSEHDEALGHRRRYVASEFSSALRSVGFEIVKISYLITFPFPIILLYRAFRGFIHKKRSRRTSYVMLPKWLNSFFVGILRLEGLLLRYINFPFGTSIICIARKPKDL